MSQKNERMPITKDIAGNCKSQRQGVIVFKVTEKNIRAVANENAVYLRHFTVTFSESFPRVDFD